MGLTQVMIYEYEKSSFRTEAISAADSLCAMTPDQLITFAAVAEHLNISRAALALHLCSRGVGAASASFRMSSARRSISAKGAACA